MTIARVQLTLPEGVMRDSLFNVSAHLEWLEAWRALDNLFEQAQEAEIRVVGVDVAEKALQQPEDFRTGIDSVREEQIFRLIKTLRDTLPPEEGAVVLLGAGHFPHLIARCTEVGMEALFHFVCSPESASVLFKGVVPETVDLCSEGEVALVAKRIHSKVCVQIRLTVSPQLLDEALKLLSDFFKLTFTAFIHEDGRADALLEMSQEGASKVASKLIRFFKKGDVDLTYTAGKTHLIIPGINKRSGRALLEKLVRMLQPVAATEA